VIIFINGAFGVGKTEVANILEGYSPDSTIFDPEDVGAMLRRTLHAKDPQKDFQGYRLWASLVADIVRMIQRQYGGTLIVPMTVYDAQRFRYLVEQFRNADPDFHHFCLVATPSTIRERLRSRGETEGGWGFQHIQRCSAVFSSPDFEVRINTEDLTPDQGADAILAKIAR